MGWLSRLNLRIGCWPRDRRGGLAVWAALLTAPAAVLAFGLVDINRASVSKRNLQDALDAAALMTARSNAVSAGDIQSSGVAALNAQLIGKLDEATLTSASFISSGPVIEATASIKVTPVVANLWLNGDMTVGARSEVMRSVTKLEVAMVLDTTGSMAGSKMTNLKAASIDFIDQMAAAAARSTETDPVKIGIVPFSSAVRLGSTTSEISTYKAANWMDAAGNAPASKEIFWTSGSNYGATVNRFTLFDNMGATWAGCVESREAPYDVQDTAPSAGAPATLFTPYFWPDEADTDSNAVNQYADDKKGGSGNAASWNQEKRQGNITKYTKNNVSISSSQGPNLGCSMQSVTRLSTNWADLKSKINGMTAVGETHIPLGMMWGWHVVSPNAPFGDGVPYSTPKTTKVVILMTDGDNTWFNSSSVNGTKYAGYAYHWQDRAGTTSSNANTRANRLNSRLTTLCNNMRAAGIVVYTVRVEVKSGSSSLLQNCATTPDKFYDVQSASNLTAVFSAIAGSIQNLRIAA